MTSVSILKAVLLLVFIANSEAHHLQWCPALRNESWSYSGHNGPYHWEDTYPECGGDNQSPIHILSDKAEKNENLAPLQLVNYDQPITKATIENNGHSIEVEPKDGVNRTISVNGETYFLRQFHFHWGSAPYKGSEHVIDWECYSMELHFVHMNEKNEIAVVGVLFQEQDDGNNEELQKIVGKLPDVKYKESETELESGLNINKLLPSNPTSFYRYSGSLTTPNCREGVTWSVIPDIMSVGHDQMKGFRSVYATIEEKAEETCRLVNNFRPTEDLNGRQVYLSQ